MMIQVLIGIVPSSGTPGILLRIRRMVRSAQANGSRLRPKMMMSHPGPGRASPASPMPITVNPPTMRARRMMTLRRASSTVSS